LDEPTTFLDPFHQQLIIKTLEKIHTEFNTTIIAVTHDISSVIERYTNVLGLKGGKVLFSGKLLKESIETTEIYKQIFDVEFEFVESISGRKVILQKQ
jgi:iron complex transport system ATP-binding protein